MTLRARQFHERAVLLRRRRSGHRNDYGEWAEDPDVREPIRVASAPADGEERQLEAGGGKVEERRKFWMRERAGAGDEMEYDGDRWRVEFVDWWGDFAEARAVRQDEG